MKRPIEPKEVGTSKDVQVPLDIQTQELVDAKGPIQHSMLRDVVNS